MEDQIKKRAIRNFKYEQVERRGWRVYYHKLCLHCNGEYQSIRMDSAFCGIRCAKASRRKRKFIIKGI